MKTVGCSMPSRTFAKRCIATGLKYACWATVWTSRKQRWIGCGRTTDDPARLKRRVDGVDRRAQRLVRGEVERRPLLDSR